MANLISDIWSGLKELFSDEVHRNAMGFIRDWFYTERKLWKK